MSFLNHWEAICPTGQESGLVRAALLKPNPPLARGRDAVILATSSHVSSAIPKMWNKHDHNRLTNPATQSGGTTLSK